MSTIGLSAMEIVFTAKRDLFRKGEHFRQKRLSKDIIFLIHEEKENKLPQGSQMIVVSAHNGSKMVLIVTHNRWFCLLLSNV